MTADGFSKAFSEKLETVRSKTSHAPRPSFDGVTCASTFREFVMVDVQYFQRLIRNAPNKNCDLDPVPTWVVKQFLEELSPFITTLFNASLRDGIFPTTQKCALVTPVLKKSNLDSTNPNNYRPISNLSFLSKMLERCANDQANTYFMENGLLPEVQSAYRKFHSTESAVLKVLSDIYSEADKGRVTLLALLDMSAAFDTVDHAILLERLHFRFGFDDVALRWFRSYLTGRSQRVRYGVATSSVVLVSCGVPQGSVLGPVLFLVYSADAIAISDKHGFSAHVYADDMQLYDHADQHDCAFLIVRLSTCVGEISEWMASNRLCLNPTKTEIIWLGSTRRIANCPVDPQDIAGAMIVPSKLIRDLGVMVDDDLTLTAHVNHLSSSGSINYVNYAPSVVLCRQTPLMLWSVHWSIVDSTIVMECLPECRNTTSIGYNLCFYRLLVSHCACQAPPV